jgi:hypothetical protein
VVRIFLLGARIWGEITRRFDAVEDGFRLA